MDTILSLYDLTGTWSKYYRESGDYEVRQVDLAGSGEDLRLLTLEDLGVDLDSVTGIIAQPPCTHFAGSGARWWAKKGDDAVREGLALVDLVYRYASLCPNLRWYVIENPVGRLGRWIGDPVARYQPHEYAGWAETDEEKEANRYTKRTCLWGQGWTIPEKKDLGKHPDPKIGERVWRMAPGPNRAHARSVTPSGFARAWFEENK